MSRDRLALVIFAGQQERDRQQKNRLQCHPDQARGRIGQISKRKKHKGFERRPNVRQRSATDLDRRSKFLLNFPLEGRVVESSALAALDDPAGGIEGREVDVPLKNRIVHLPNHPNIKRCEPQQTEQSRPEREGADQAGISLSRKEDVAHFGTKGAILYRFVTATV